MRNIYIVLLPLLACLLAPVALTGQNFPTRGFLPGLAYDKGQADSVNLLTGTMGYEVPLYQFPAGPGGQNFKLGLSYSSRIYDVQSDTTIGPSTTGGGWRYTYLYSMEEGYAATFGCNNNKTKVSYCLSVVFSDASRH